MNNQKKKKRRQSLQLNQLAAKEINNRRLKQFLIEYPKFIHIDENECHNWIGPKEISDPQPDEWTIIHREISMVDPIWTIQNLLIDTGPCPLCKVECYYEELDRIYFERARKCKNITCLNKDHLYLYDSRLPFSLYKQGMNIEHIANEIGCSVEWIEEQHIEVLLEREKKYPHVFDLEYEKDWNLKEITEHKFLWLYEYGDFIYNNHIKVSSFDTPEYLNEVWEYIKQEHSIN